MSKNKGKNSSKKIWLIALVVLLIAISCLFIGNRNNKIEDERGTVTESENKVNEDVSEKNSDKVSVSWEDKKNKYKDIENNPIVIMKIKDMGTIKIELYPSIAPETVENFIELVQSGFYDGLIFHRVIPGFMAQGGDKAGTGMGSSPYSIKGEFSSNGVENSLSHTRGIVSMARTSVSMDSAYSQFFIVTSDSTYLDGEYAAFGEVIEGMDVVDQIVNQEVIRRKIDDDVSYYTDPEEYITQMAECDRPVDPPVIESATVELFGVEYGSPNKISTQN